MVGGVTGGQATVNAAFIEPPNIKASCQDLQLATELEHPGVVDRVRGPAAEHHDVQEPT